MSVRGLFAGVLGLTFLQAVLSSDAATSRTSGLISGLTGAFHHFMSPTVALIPDLRKQSRETVAPGPLGTNPLAIIPQDSSTSSGSMVPASWTTRPAAPRSV